MSQLEEYDMMVRELGFEMKAQPSEKMKTPEELAREEREKLQKLEVCSQCRSLCPVFIGVETFSCRGGRHLVFVTFIFCFYTFETSA